MAGHIKKREGVTAKGKKYIKWRACFPDPTRGGRIVEKTFPEDKLDDAEA